MGKSLQLFVILVIFCVKIHSIYSTDNLFTSEKKNVYYIENEKKYTWMEALTKCTSMNMSLATIDTEEKSNEITDLLRKTFANVNPLWIGAVLNGADHRQYKWISTGKQFTFTNWAQGQPDNWGNTEYCIQTGWSNEIKWNDHECFFKFGLICEYNQYYHWLDEMQVKLEKEQAEKEHLQYALFKIAEIIAAL